MQTLNLIDKAFLLKKTLLFGHLDLDALLTISDKMGLSFYREGASVFRLHQAANQMYLVVTGSILIKDRSRNSIATIQAGDFFGDEAIFNERPRAYEAICQTNATLLTLSRSHLLTIISECPTVALGLLEVYTSPIDFRARESRSKFDKETI